jgi:glycosyltransferase involved in cell wall biosynthesis
MSHNGLIGVIDLAMSGWMAGSVVSRTMALSLQAVGAEVAFLTGKPDQAPAGLRTLQPPPPKYLPGEWTLRKITGGRKASMSAAWLRESGVRVVLPDVESLSSGSTKAIGWIPDFQHLHLGKLYSEAQIAQMNRAFGDLARRSARMLFSSEDCRRDFVTAYPDFAAKARVASFPSLFAFEPPAPPEGEVRAKYHLPERFLLIINQFWRHKNHRIVPEALSILRKRGVEVTAVMAGLPADHRDRQNDALSETLQAAARGQVWPQCLVLGKVPREDLVALLQTATAVVQPSRFEGWNTTLQDAKAVGCPVFVSDLAVHREQCPKALGFFPVDDPEKLADLIAEHWPSLPARPDAEREKAALAAESEYARAYGRKLLEICTEVL